MLITGIPALIPALLLAPFVYSVSLSPLKDIPGPTLAAVSDLWFTTHLMRFQQTSTIHELFQKYGPVVRVGPQKIAFCKVAAMREVYSHQKFPKSAMYSIFKILTLLDNPSHSERRKALGSHYNAGNVSRLQPEIHKAALNLVHVDIVVFSTFGHDLGALQKWTLNQPDHISDAITDFPKMGIVSSLFLTLAWKAVSQIPHERWRRFTRTIPILKQFVVARIREVQELGAGKESDTSPLIQRLLQFRGSSTNEPLSMETVVAEAVSHLQATEVEGIMPDGGREIPDLSVLQALPYMTALIQEGLRVRTMVPSLLERIVPRRGNFQLMEYSLPPGTVVGTQAWSIHRDSEVFASPETFDLDRWLDDKGLAVRAAPMMPFELGTRVCVGHALAQTALCIALAALVRNFAITADQSTTRASMTMRHGFVWLLNTSS
ncbi:cytochrome P450 [Mycena leptocephala]|nr:cytochrome P450 [Mycena leptocephala]